MHTKHIVTSLALAASLLAACGDQDESALPSGSPSASAGPPGSPTDASTPPGPTGTTPPAGSCPERALARLTLEQRVGQLFMGGVDVGRSPAFVSVRLGDASAGSLLLIGKLTGGVDAAARAAERGRTVAGSPAGVRPFVAVDQEGGLVQHLKGPGFATMPAAEQQSRLSTGELRDRATAWADDLRDGAVDLNLAPVADVVPESIGSSNQPIEAVHRGYGSDPAEVSRHVAAYVQGMAQSGIDTAVKHFPGLGKVEGNTDFSSGVIDALTTADDPDLAPFAAALDAGARFLMVSLATYERIDPDHRAVFSSRVIEQMVRADLGFDGVVLSDDLSRAKEVQSVPAGQRAVDFLAAGGDIVVVADPSVLPEMTAAVLQRARSDDAFAASVEEHVLRVLSAKKQMGLLDCRR